MSGCHPSAPTLISIQDGVIPVPRHWDDKKRSTGMTPFVVFNKVRT
ncbi:hypothetical protein [Wolbachia endosymbiont (group A) of Apoderus coryli]|nr:hypothetical protein [Wolbachia endosymbiont (group A) of Apoderus coryli]